MPDWISIKVYLKHPFVPCSTSALCPMLKWDPGFAGMPFALIQVYERLLSGRLSSHSHLGLGKEFIDVKPETQSIKLLEAINWFLSKFRSFALQLILLREWKGKLQIGGKGSKSNIQKKDLHPQYTKNSQNSAIRKQHNF